MVTRKRRTGEAEALKRLGKKIEEIILVERKYRSLDAFALEHSEVIAKPTLYEICRGARDMKFSTLLGLAKALGIPLAALLSGF